MMIPKLVYVLVMMGSGAQPWHGAVDLHTTTELGRCERMQAQLKSVPFNGRNYRCMEMVIPASLAATYASK